MAEASPARRRTTDLLRPLESTRAELRAAVDTIDVATRATRPGGDRWSVAEVLEHVAIVERRITHLVTTRMAGQARAAFLDVVRATDGLALDSATAPHPSFGPLDLLQWIIFVGTHEKRHAEQIREIRLETGQEAAS